MDKEDKKKDRKSFKEHDPSKYINVEPTIDEAVSGKTAVVTFGRMNPITVGHEKLVNSLIQNAASRKGAVPMVYLSHSSDPIKNPLSYEKKIKFAKQAFGNVIKQSKARTIIEVMKELNGKYANVIVVVGSDRYGEFDKLLNKYNGKEYNFQNIEIASAGARDPDAEGVKGMSASKMREYAKDGNLNKFKKGLPKKLQNNAEEVLSAVRQAMNITEQLDEALSRAGRRKRAMAMRRARAKIKLGRERARKKRATPEKLKQRARRRAITALKDKFSRHKRYSDLTPAEKEQVEKRIAKINKARIERMAQKQLIYVKRDDRDKFKTVRKEEIDLMSFSQFNEAKMKNPQDPDVKDMPGTQPKSYYKGVDKDKKDDRARHFKRNSKKSDDDPSAYKPAPGDKEAKTKESPHTKRYRRMYGEMNEWVCGACHAEPCMCEGDGTELNEMWGKYNTKRPHMLMDKNNKPKFDKRFKMFKPKHVQEMNEFEIEDIVELMESTEDFALELNEDPTASLKKKAEKTGMPLGILRKVYNRGVAAWRTGHKPGTTPEQWGHARVNSFVTKSSGTWGKADKDLAAKVRKESLDERFEAFLDEKLKASDDMGKWVDDFYKSDAPQFKGKSKDERRKMAIAAKLSAERNEETEIDELSMSLKDLSKSGVGNVSKAMKADKTKKELEALKKRLNKEEHGAGDEGTPELVKKLKKDTPNA